MDDQANVNNPKIKYETIHAYYKKWYIHTKNKIKSSILDKKTRPSILPTSSKIELPLQDPKTNSWPSFRGTQTWCDHKLGVIIIEVKNIIVAAER
jgi:hypothetical protein